LLPDKSQPVPVPGSPLEKPPVAPSLENCRELLRRAFFLGAVRMSPHFVKRCGERQFSMSDAYSLLENGIAHAGPEYDSEFHTWRCELVGKIDRKTWKIVVALECGIDLMAKPVATLITVHRSDARKNRRKV
jgi:hypothetical protein